MLKILQKLKFENLKKVLTTTFRRFPLSMIISFLAFVLIVVRIRLEDLPQSLEDNFDKTIFTLIITFFFSVGIYLYSETRDISKQKKEMYQLVTFFFGALFFYFFEENLFSNPAEEVVVYFVLTFLGVISFVFIAPFISKLFNKNLSQNEFYIASFSLIVKTLMSIIVGVLTMLLGFIALSATFSLFDITFIDKSNWFGYWASFSLVLFSPIFFLSVLSSSENGEEGETEKIRANKFYSFLINYVSLPAIIIYFLILYAYSLKVLLHFSDWPQGQIAWMVILFSFFGYLVFVATFIFVDIFKPALFFRKIFPLAVFLQTFMLFYAIGLRINQYDLTINRYLVVAFGLWLFGLSLYYIFSKKKSLSVPFYSLLLVIIFISIGPWSVYVVPEWRQAIHLEENLKKAHILQASGDIIPLKKYTEISPKLSGQIYGGIEYLCNYHGCDTLDKYFAKEISEIKKEDREEFEKNKQEQLKRAEQSKMRDEEYIESIRTREYSEIRNWKLISKLSEKIKVRMYQKNNSAEESPMNLNFRNNNKYLNDSIDIRGYDYLVRVFASNSERKRLLNVFENDTEKVDLSSVYNVVLDVDNKKLEIYLGENLIEAFGIEETVIKPLLAKKDDSLDYKHFGYEQDVLLTSKDMTFDLVGTHYDVRLVLANISISNPEWVATESDNNRRPNNDFGVKTRMIDFNYASGYVLIKEK